MIQSDDKNYAVFNLLQFIDNVHDLMRLEPTIPMVTLAELNDIIDKLPCDMPKCYLFQGYMSRLADPSRSIVYNRMQGPECTPNLHSLNVINKKGQHSLGFHAEALLSQSMGSFINSVRVGLQVNVLNVLESPFLTSNWNPKPFLHNEASRISSNLAEEYPRSQLEPTAGDDMTHPKVFLLELYRENASTVTATLVKAFPMDSTDGV